MTRRQKVKAVHREQRRSKVRRKASEVSGRNRNRSVVLSSFSNNLGMDHNSMMGLILGVLGRQKKG